MPYFDDVELGDLDLASKLGVDLFEAGCDHLARRAPFYREVDEDRFGRLQNFFRESGRIDVHYEVLPFMNENQDNPLAV